MVVDRYYEVSRLVVLNVLVTHITGPGVELVLAHVAWPPETAGASQQVYCAAGTRTLVYTCRDMGYTLRVMVCCELKHTSLSKCSSVQHNVKWQCVWESQEDSRDKY